MQNLAGVKNFNDYYEEYYYPQYSDILYIVYPNSHQEISHPGRTTQRYRYVTKKTLVRGAPLLLLLANRLLLYRFLCRCPLLGGRLFLLLFLLCCGILRVGCGNYRNGHFLVCRPFMMVSAYIVQLLFNGTRLFFRNLQILNQRRFLWEFLTVNAVVCLQRIVGMVLHLPLQCFHVANVPAVDTYNVRPKRKKEY